MGDCSILHPNNSTHRNLVTLWKSSRISELIFHCWQNIAVQRQNMGKKSTGGTNLKCKWLLLIFGSQLGEIHLKIYKLCVTGIYN